ncbi:MAG: hypothetical protein N2319_13895 [Candidatus Kapabacteria bacterium]|nr:hypothetical protein [Candidatus Kapabacteria bacterium]
MKTRIFLFMLLLLSLTVISNSQNDIQSWQARINQITQKQFADLTNEDISFLKSVINTNKLTYGERYQKIVEDKKADVSKFLREYERWVEQKEKEKQLSTELGEEKERTKEQQSIIEAQIDTIAAKEKIIAELRAQIEKMRSEIKKIKSVNEKIKSEQKSLQAVLDENISVVRRLRGLLSRNDEMAANTPADLKADLENTECDLAELLKSNYLLTIERLKADKTALDSLQKFYREKKVYPSQIEKYIADGEELANRFSSSSVECVKRNSEEILTAISDIKSLMEAEECGFFCKIGKFITENLAVSIIILLALLALIILLIVKSGKKKE